MMILRLVADRGDSLVLSPTGLECPDAAPVLLWVEDGPRFGLNRDGGYNLYTEVGLEYNDKRYRGRLATYTDMSRSLTGYHTIHVVKGMRPA